MITETPQPRSRRALLAAAIGATVATLAAAVGRPLSARAADGETVLVGGEYMATSATTFDTGNTRAVALLGTSEAIGVVGSSNGIGVQGSSSVGTGVEGFNVTGGAGIVGGSNDATGVLGISGPHRWPHLPGLAPDETGVYGYADQGAHSRGVTGGSLAGRGVFGSATTGSGVYGVAGSGTAVHAVSGDPLVGYALRAVGRVKFDKCAGRATIAAGTKSVTVVPGIDVVSTAAIVATLQGSAGGTTTVHRVAVDTFNNTFTIYLTANSTANVKVAWHIFG